MSSTFIGQGIFNSGPHRFRILAEGELVVPFTRINPFQPGSSPAGPLELQIEVSGRLVASSESTLWALRDAIDAMLTHPPRVGPLVDHSGRSFADMSFVRFEPGDRVDRGRVWTLPYVASFVRFLK